MVVVGAAVVDVARRVVVDVCAVVVDRRLTTPAYELARVVRCTGCVDDVAAPVGGAVVEEEEEDEELMVLPSPVGPAGAANAAAAIRTSTGAPCLPVATDSPGPRPAPSATSGITTIPVHSTTGTRT